MNKYRKFLTVVVGVVISALLRHYGNNDLLVNDLILAATAAGVFVVPNKQA